MEVQMEKREVPSKVLNFLENAFTYLKNFGEVSEEKKPKKKVRTDNRVLQLMAEREKFLAVYDVFEDEAEYCGIDEADILNVLPYQRNERIKSQAFEKMLGEMSKEHSTTEDVIHNWLCEQEDEELFKGILKDGKTIGDALAYCGSQASKVKTNNVAMVDDTTVFSWIREYFLKDEVKIEKFPTKVSTITTEKTTQTKVNTQRIEMKKDEQISLFDFL